MPHHLCICAHRMCVHVYVCVYIYRREHDEAYVRPNSWSEKVHCSRKMQGPRYSEEKARLNRRKEKPNKSADKGAIIECRTLRFVFCIFFFFGENCDWTDAMLIRKADIERINKEPNCCNFTAGIIKSWRDRRCSVKKFKRPNRNWWIAFRIYDQYWGRLCS